MEHFFSCLGYFGVLVLFLISLNKWIVAVKDKKLTLSTIEGAKEGRDLTELYDMLSKEKDQIGIWRFLFIICFILLYLGYQEGF